MTEPKRRGRPKKTVKSSHVILDLEALKEKYGDDDLAKMKEVMDQTGWQIMHSWQSKVEAYCKEMGLTPERLLHEHKEMKDRLGLSISAPKAPGFKGILPTIKEAIENGGEAPKHKGMTIKDFNEVTKRYDPFKNPRFNNKIGKKDDSSK